MKTTTTQYKTWIYGFLSLFCATIFVYSCVKEKFEPLRPLEGLVLKPNQIEIEVNQSVPIQILAVPENSVNKHAFYIQYTDENPKVRAEVTDQGKTLKVTGLAATEEEIWLIYKDNEQIKAKIEVIVYEKPENKKR